MAHGSERKMEMELKETIDEYITVFEIVFCALKNFSRNRRMAVRRKWPTGADDGRPERSDHMSEKEKTLRAFAEILKILQDNGYHFSEFDKGRIYEMMHRAQCVAASS